MKKVKKIIKNFEYSNRLETESALMSMSVEIAPSLIHALSDEHESYKREIYYKALLNLDDKLFKECFNIIKKNIHDPSKSHIVKTANNLLMMDYHRQINSRN